MTLQGTVNKSLLKLLLLMLPATFVWGEFFSGNAAIAAPATMIGAIVGFILALVTVFKAPWAPVTAPLYALAQGLFLGGASAALEMRFPGVVIQAVGLTTLVFA